jgi:hypothetical protein
MPPRREMTDGMWTMLADERTVAPVFNYVTFDRSDTTERDLDWYERNDQAYSGMRDFTEALAQKVIDNVDWTRLLHAASGRHLRHVKEGDHRDMVVGEIRGVCGKCIKEVMNDPVTCEGLNDATIERVRQRELDEAANKADYGF